MSESSCHACVRGAKKRLSPDKYLHVYSILINHSNQPFSVVNNYVVRIYIYTYGIRTYAYVYTNVYIYAHAYIRMDAYTCI